KILLRVLDGNGRFVQDLICLNDDLPVSGAAVYDPTNPLRWKKLPADCRLLELRREVMHEGRRTVPDESLETMAARCSCELALLPDGCLRLVNPHRYKVSISERLHGLRSSLTEKLSVKG